MIKVNLKAGVNKVICSLPPSITEAAKTLGLNKDETPAVNPQHETARTKRLHRRMKNRKGETATAEFDEHLPKALKAYLKKNPAAGTEHTEGAPAEDLDKDKLDAQALSLQLFGETFTQNLSAITLENGLAENEFVELFSNFAAVSPAVVRAWLHAEAMPTTGEFKLLACFFGFRNNQSDFMRGMLRQNFLRTYRNALATEGVSHSFRRGLTIKELLEESSVALSGHDRGILLSIAESLRKSTPLEIAERLVSQQKEIAALKENTDLLATRFVEERNRLDSVIQYLNARAERARRWLCLVAVLGLVAVGSMVAWQTGGISSGAAPQATTSSVAH